MRCDPHTDRTVDVLEGCANFLAFLASWAAAIATTEGRVEEHNAIQAPEAFEGLSQAAIAWETRLRDASRHVMSQCPDVPAKQEDIA